MYRVVRSTELPDAREGVDSNKEDKLLSCLSDWAESDPSDWKWRRPGSGTKTGYRIDTEMPTWPREHPPAACRRCCSCPQLSRSSASWEGGLHNARRFPSLASCLKNVGPAPDWLGISPWRLIGYWPPLRSGLCHTHGRTWTWVLALG